MTRFDAVVSTTSSKSSRSRTSGWLAAVRAARAISGPLSFLLRAITSTSSASTRSTTATSSAAPWMRMVSPRSPMVTPSSSSRARRWASPGPVSRSIRSWSLISTSAVVRISAVGGSEVMSG